MYGMVYMYGYLYVSRWFGVRLRVYGRTGSSPSVVKEGVAIVCASGAEIKASIGSVPSVCVFVYLSVVASINCGCGDARWAGSRLKRTGGGGEWVGRPSPTTSTICTRATIN